MSDASAMVERCGRHQHPELFGGREVSVTCTFAEARAIVEMTADRAPVEPEPPRRDRPRASWWPDGR